MSQCRWFVVAVLITALSPVWAMPRDQNVQNRTPGTVGFDPGNDVHGQLNLLGVDLNALFNVSEPFVNPNHRVIYVGEHYIPNDHIFPRSEEDAEAGGHPDSIATLSDKLAYLRYEVSGGDPFLTRQYVFDGGDIENRWDYIHQDPLECGDFFPMVCVQRVGVPASGPMVTWLPKLPPLPTGHYVVRTFISFYAPYESATITFPAGETAKGVMAFDVLPGNRPR